MNKYESDVLMYISSRLRKSDFYQKYIDKYKKENDCKSQVEAVDGLDIEIDQFINKHFFQSNSQEFLVFLQDIKYIYKKIYVIIKKAI
ncbi:hypothetical protein CSA08_02000 [Candidatus Gracilibacteria bacterium]|nr:MAG: hypothetical protein CSA08_02000 [Candidatus Gracilibacteria bacterium]